MLQLLQYTNTDTLPLDRIYTECKFWLAFIGALWTMFRWSQWIKEIRTVDLARVQEYIGAHRRETKEQAESLAAAIKENTVTVGESYKEQTTAVVRELGEIRQDFRTFYTSPVPQMERVTPRRKEKPRK